MNANHRFCHIDAMHEINANLKSITKFNQKDFACVELF